MVDQRAGPFDTAQFTFTSQTELLPPESDLPEGPYTVDFPLSMA